MGRGKSADDLLQAKFPTIPTEGSGTEPYK